MTPEEFNQEMEKCEEEGIEDGHTMADGLLVALIQEKLPEYSRGLEVFESMTKWYA